MDPIDPATLEAEVSDIEVALTLREGLYIPGGRLVVLGVVALGEECGDGDEVAPDLLDERGRRGDGRRDGHPSVCLSLLSACTQDEADEAQQE